MCTSGWIVCIIWAAMHKPFFFSLHPLINFQYPSAQAIKRTLQEKAEEVFNMFKKQLRMVLDQTNKNISFPEQLPQVADIVHYITDSKHSLDKPLEVGLLNCSLRFSIWFWPTLIKNSPFFSCPGASESWPLRGVHRWAGSLHPQTDNSISGGNGEENLCRLEPESGGAVLEETGTAPDGTLQGYHEAGPQLWQVS